MYDIGINAKRVNSFYSVNSIEIVTKIATQSLGSFTQKNRKKKRSNKNIVLHHIYQNCEGNSDIPDSSLQTYKTSLILPSSFQKPQLLLQNNIRLEYDSRVAHVP